MQNVLHKTPHELHSVYYVAHEESKSPSQPFCVTSQKTAAKETRRKKAVAFDFAFSFPVSTLYVRDAWNRDPPFGDQDKTVCIL